jgi:hypothetical protein
MILTRFCQSTSVRNMQFCFIPTGYVILPFAHVLAQYGIPSLAIFCLFPFKVGLELKNNPFFYYSKLVTVYVKQKFICCIKPPLPPSALPIIVCVCHLGPSRG